MALDDRLHLLILRTWVQLSVSDRHLEDVTVPRERELIHRVDFEEVEQHEKEGSSDATARSVRVTSLIDLFHCVGGALKTLGYILLSFLCSLKRLDQRDVLKQRHAFVLQPVQNIILQAFEFSLTILDLVDERVLVLLKGGLLL